MIDPNTVKILDSDNTDTGHKTGNESRTRKKTHRQKGSLENKLLKKKIILIYSN